MKEALSALVDWEHSFLPEESEALHSFLVAAEESSNETPVESSDGYEEPGVAVADTVRN